MDTERSDEADLSGATISDRYELLTLLGRGGMGEVYQARDQELERRVAVKFMNATDETDRHRFDREARLTARLQHPNIVTVLDFGEHRFQPYLVLELLSGGTLEDLLRANGPLEPDRVAGLGEQVCHALSHAHEHGVVHRDLKAANVFVEDAYAGRPGFVKVGDFGIAKSLDPADPSLTGTGPAAMGTPSHLAPERCRLEATPRTDLFALGVMLYQMLTGRLPFEGATSHEVATRVLAGRYAPLPPSLGRRWARLVDRLLATDPAQRPASAAEVARELASLRSPWRRRAIPLAAAVVGALVLAAGAWWVARPRVPLPVVAPPSVATEGGAPAPAEPSLAPSVAPADEPPPSVVTAPPAEPAAAEDEPTAPVARPATRPTRRKKKAAVATERAAEPVAAPEPEPELREPDRLPPAPETVFTVPERL